VQVLILGAGASKPAGYPVAGELISAIEEFVRADREILLKNYWDRWTSWRNSAQGIVKELLSNPNPEVVLSLPDLYEAALHAADIDQLQKVHRKWKAGEITEEDLRRHEEYYQTQEHKELSAARSALIGLLECLQRFFFFLHYQDRKDRVKRDYLRRHLAPLSEGDVVITLNLNCCGN